MRTVIAIILGLTAILLLAGWAMQRVADRPGPRPGQVVTLTVAKGDGVRQVADELFRAGVIRERWHWNFYIILSGRRSAILAGRYKLDGGLSVRRIAVALTTTPTSEREVTVTIREGSRLTDVATQLERAGVVAAKDFLAASAAKVYTVDPQFAWLAEKPASVDLEGYLFPDTYRFFKGSKPAAVIEKMLKNFDRKFTPGLRAAAAARRRTVFQTVTMASILEAELQTDTDRSLASDLFWRRLDAGIALQSDATVNYVTGKGRLQPSIADTQVDSPYNTYKYRGLPPGPINNPGLSAIRAAINPTPNEYWFYLTTKEGKTIFSKTLEEHNRNKRTYLGSSVLTPGPHLAILPTLPQTIGFPANTKGM